MSDFVYLVIRQIDSLVGPEVDVFTDFDLAHEWAETLRASGREAVEQEQRFLTRQIIDEMKHTL